MGQNLYYGYRDIIFKGWKNFVQKFKVHYMDANGKEQLENSIAFPIYLMQHVCWGSVNLDRTIHFTMAHLERNVSLNTLSSKHRTCWLCLKGSSKCSCVKEP